MSLRNKSIGYGLAGVLLFPSIVSAESNLEKNKPNQKTEIVSEGRTAKPVLASGLSIVAPMEDFSMERNSTDKHIDLDDVYSYSGTYGIRTEIEELDPEDLIDASVDADNKLVVGSSDKLGRAGIVVNFYEDYSTAVAPTTWGAVKNMFSDRETKKSAKVCLESVSDTVYVNVISNNQKPVISEVPDIDFKEDGSFDLSLDGYVTDPDNSNDELSWTAQSGDFDVDIDPETRAANIRPEKDWNGAGYVDFVVRDPEGLTDYKRVNVNVEPMSDVRHNVWSLFWEELNQERAVQGAVVSVNGVADTTDEQGNVDFQIEPGFYRMEIAHDDFYGPRITSVLDFTDDRTGDENIVYRHDVEVCEFRHDGTVVRYYKDFMELFDEWCRSINGCIQRWVTQPKWYINTSPAYGSGNEVTQDKIDLVYEIIQNERVQHATGFDEPYIEEGENPPEKGADGWIKEYWRDDCSSSHGELLDGNRIYHAIVHFGTYNTEKRVYVEELAQVLGLGGAVSTAFPWDEHGNYLSVYWDILKFLYSREDGNTSPDRDP